MHEYHSTVNTIVDHDGINWMLPLQVFQLQLQLADLFPLMDISVTVNLNHTVSTAIVNHVDDTIHVCEWVSESHWTVNSRCRITN